MAPIKIFTFLIEFFFKGRQVLIFSIYSLFFSHDQGIQISNQRLLDLLSDFLGHIN
jgi:hypothetical protein